MADAKFSNWVSRDHFRTMSRLLLPKFRMLHTEAAAGTVAVFVLPRLSRPTCSGSLTKWVALTQEEEEMASLQHLAGAQGTAD